MKLSKIIFLTGLFCLLLAGCSDNSPQGVAKAYCEALFSGDFKKAKSLCTPQTEEVVDLVASMMKKEYMEKVKSAKIEAYVVDYVINEEEGTAKVTLKVTVKEKDKEKQEVQDQKVEMVKVDGKWRVSLKLK